MKKLFPSLLALVVALMPAIPAQAQEKTMEERVKALEETLTGWSIYGSIRYDTFYNKSDSDFTGDTFAVTRVNSTATPAITLPDQKYTQWALANNSRLGISVDRKDNIAGRVELGLRNDATVGLRIGYGTYAMGGVTILWGQDWTPLSDWDYSTQVYFADNNLGGWGVMDVDGKRLPQVKIKWNGLQVALVYPKGATTLNLASSANASAEVFLPTLQAKYRLSVDKFFADIFGGAGTYKVKSNVLDVDRTVNSYTGGLGGGVKADPVYLKAMVYWARNGKQMSLAQADAAGATIDLDGSLIREDTMGWALIAGAKLDGLSVEAGYGYVSSDQNAGNTRKNRARNYYANVSIPVAQNAAKTELVTIVPEVGVYDYMKDAGGNRQGKISYCGAKWQVSF